MVVPASPDLEDGVDHLAERCGILVDEEFRSALNGNRIGASERTWRHRYRRTVGYRWPLINVAVTSNTAGSIWRATGNFRLLKFSRGSRGCAKSRWAFANQYSL